MKFKHYFSFSTKLNREAHSSQKVDLDWASLRENGGQSFAMEDSKEDYIQNAKRASTYKTYAEEILNVLGGETKSLCSLGVGKGVLEWWIKSLSPEIELCCTDYTAKSLETLKDYFPECDEIKTFDMLHGDYSILADYDAILLFRVSTEFDSQEWNDIFEKIAAARIRKVVFVPAELMTAKDIVGEIYRRMKAVIQEEESVFCGWLYSESEFKKMFSKYFLIDNKKYVLNTGIYVLKRKV